MGSVCCCLQTGDIEDVLQSSSAYRNCICFNCVVDNFLFVYTMLFRREIHAVPSSIEEASAMTSTASPDNYFSDMYHSPPRPLPYDTEPRHLRMQREGLVPRHEKGSSHANEESEPLRSDTDGESDNICSEGKLTNYAREKGVKEQPYKTSLRLSSAKANADIGHIYTTSEEEDVCPTCLEEYTPENPRIMTECSHHFHLGCIYEWKERSDSCPVCGKVMVFDET